MKFTQFFLVFRHYFHQNIISVIRHPHIRAGIIISKIECQWLIQGMIFVDEFQYWLSRSETDFIDLPIDFIFEMKFRWSSVLENFGLKLNWFNLLLFTMNTMQIFQHVIRKLLFAFLTDHNGNHKRNKNGVHSKIRFINLLKCLRPFLAKIESLK